VSSWLNCAGLRCSITLVGKAKDKLWLTNALLRQNERLTRVFAKERELSLLGRSLVDSSSRRHLNAPQARAFTRGCTFGTVHVVDSASITMCMGRDSTKVLSMPCVIMRCVALPIIVYLSRTELTFNSRRQRTREWTRWQGVTMARKELLKSP
jgi:hypothetical protein